MSTPRLIRSRSLIYAGVFIVVLGVWLGLAFWGCESTTRVVISLRGTVTIVVPDNPSADERGAAQLIADTIAHARPTAAGAIRIVARSAPGGSNRPAIYIGRRAARGGGLPPWRGDPHWDATVGYHVLSRGVVIDALADNQLRFAASVFLENNVGARWFIPGPLGLEVQRMERLDLRAGTYLVNPGYISREIGGTSRVPGGDDWRASNRLLPLVAHGHTADALMGQEVRGMHPELAPQLEGSLFMPPPNNKSWQPHLAHPMAPILAVRALNREKAKGGFNVVFGLNDSYAFDQSEATLAQIRPFRYFRKIPDYSDLLFGFLNRVAAAMPDTYISTYAYYSTENTPSFPVAANVVPFLTADRSMWFDPAFAKQDRELIERWCRAGPRLVALYDYLYGQPFFVPRPTYWAVTEPIPFAFSRGVRAYYAECAPNWGFDGPKPWLAAQLLWDPRREPVQLIDEYYARFWQEAEEPMREFFSLCEQQWKSQPAPLIWIKYFRDDHQVMLFPPEIRSRLRHHLEQAKKSARSATVLQRVLLTSEAFSLAEAFCVHEEVSQSLSRLLHDPATVTIELLDRCRTYSQVRKDLLDTFHRVKRQFPLAVDSFLTPYLRKDPRGRALAELSRRDALADLNEEDWKAIFGDDVTRRPMTKWGQCLLADSRWQELKLRNPDRFIATDWFGPGNWRNRSEPNQQRHIEMLPRVDGTKGIRISECANETIWQWQPAVPGGVYLASVGVRSRVSQGNFTYLSILFADQTGKFIGQGHIDRLPPGTWSTGRLEVMVQAPPDARFVYYTLRVMRQMDGDWVEFDAPSLHLLTMP